MYSLDRIIKTISLIALTLGCLWAFAASAAGQR